MDRDIPNETEFRIRKDMQYKYPFLSVKTWSWSKRLLKIYS